MKKNFFLVLAVGVIMAVTMILGVNFAKADGPASDSLTGYILLQVQGNGEAWYINPVDGFRYYLGRPNDAFAIMRLLGLGINNDSLKRIPTDTQSGDTSFSRRYLGRILLQVQAHGEAWYINPDNLRRYFLNRPADAFRIMRSLGKGASNDTIYRIAPNVIITNIFYNGSGSKESDEYVEIKNNGKMAQSLGGWTLEDKDKHKFTFPALNLGAGKSIRVYTNTGTYSFGSDKAIWNNTGDTAYLKAGTGALVDSYSY